MCPYQEGRAIGNEIGVESLGAVTVAAVGVESVEGKEERGVGAGEATVAEGLLCARAHVQVTKLQIRGCDLSISFELLHEDLSRWEGSSRIGGDVGEHDKAHSFLSGHQNPLIGALRAIHQKPKCSKTTCHKQFLRMIVLPSDWLTKSRLTDTLSGGSKEALASPWLMQGWV